MKVRIIRPRDDSVLYYEDAKSGVWVSGRVLDMATGRDDLLSGDGTKGYRWIYVLSHRIFDCITP